MLFYGDFEKKKKKKQILANVQCHTYPFMKWNVCNGHYMTRLELDPFQ